MPIPASITVTTAVARGARYDGVLAVSQSASLAEAGVVLSEPLRVTLQFERVRSHDDVRMTVDGAIELRCERCDGPFRQAVGIATRLRLVDSDEAEQAALAEAEPYRVERDEVVPAQMVAQELLLGLPVVVRCEACEAAVQAVEAPVSADRPTHRPFAALLKRS